MQSFGDIKLAYGESDEYSFVFSKTCSLYGVLFCACPCSCFMILLQVGSSGV